MQTLTVGADGSVAIPPEIFGHYGLQPGAEITLIKTERGLWLRPADAAAWALLRNWWESMTEEEKQEAREEAHDYWALSEEERDAIWNQGDEELARWLDEEDEDEDEDELAVSAVSATA